MHTLLEDTPTPEARDLQVLDTLGQLHRAATQHASAALAVARQELLSKADPLFAQMSEGCRRQFLGTVAKRMGLETGGVLTIVRTDIENAVTQASFARNCIPNEEHAFIVYLGAAIFAVAATMLRV